MGRMEESRFGYMFDASCAEKSKQFATYYRQVAEEKGCVFLDASTVASPDPSDHLHMSPSGHKALGKMLAEAMMKRNGG